MKRKRERERQRVRVCVDEWIWNGRMASEECTRQNGAVRDK